MKHEQDEKRAIAETLFNKTDAYHDIMRLPHHQSHRHAQMPTIERAAQFAPFAALTGYQDLIEESGQILADQSRLPFEAAQELATHLQRVAQLLPTRPHVKVTYFEDETGESRTILARVTALDPSRQWLTLAPDRQLALSNVQSLVVLPQ